MHRRRLVVALLPLATVLLGAAPELAPEDLVRQGNAAFAREEYDAALDWYARAEERITNPGLVAFNKGTALYRLNRFDEAARLYEACLSDAPAGRRADAFYDLGNCRLQQSRGSDVKRLAEAVECYAHCLRQAEAGAPLRHDATHNLELAKLLLLRARQAAAGREPGNTQENPKENPPDEKPLTDPKPPEQSPTQNPNGTPAQVVKTDIDPRGHEYNPQKGEGPSPPGKGSLPPIPDEDDLPPLGQEDATAHLIRAAERVARERRAHQRRSAPVPSRFLPDW